MTDIIYRLMKNKNSEPFKKLNTGNNAGGRGGNQRDLMDLQTVENNIKKSYYGSIEEMASDVYKIFE